jgi:hypothetical protein
LVVVLSGWIGVATGWLSGSRMVAVLAAPLWATLCLVGPLVVRAHDHPAQRLFPVLSFEVRSAVFGFLPDGLWPHLGYLLGLVLLAGVLLLALAARGSAQRPPLQPVLVAAAVGLVLVGASGARLASLPDLQLVVGPAAADRIPASPNADPVTILGPSFVFPDDHLAHSCASDATLSVCVYPAYGHRLASFALRAMQPMAGLFAGLPGVPTRVRMVPTPGPGSCRGTEIQLSEPLARITAPGRVSRLQYAEIYLLCALGERNIGTSDQGDARDAVRIWALLAGGMLTRAELPRAIGGGPAPIVVMVPPTPVGAQAALAMAELPADQVQAELAPLWERLRAGTLPLAELPGQRP